MSHNNNVSPNTATVSTFPQSSFRKFVTGVIAQAKIDIESFQAGNIKQYYDQWVSLTSDYEILCIVKGECLEFSDIPKQTRLPGEFQFSEKEKCIIDCEIAKLLQMGVLTQCVREQGDFLSNIFLRPKNDGTYRMILNLKPFNKYLQYHHFKMDTLKTAVAMVRPNCYMASIDLTDAYYSVPIKEPHQKYLKI